MKKAMSIFTALLLVTMIFTVSAFAYGRCGGYSRTGYALCAVENCGINYTHLHDNTWCGGHFIGDGHDYHTLCNVSDCALTTIHEHDGVTYFPQPQSQSYGYNTCCRGGGGQYR